MFLVLDDNARNHLTRAWHESSKGARSHDWMTDDKITFVCCCAVSLYMGSQIHISYFFLRRPDSYVVHPQRPDSLSKRSDLESPQRRASRQASD